MTSRAHNTHPGRHKKHLVRVAVRSLITQLTGTLYMYDAAYQPDLNAVKSHGGIAISRYFVGNGASWQWKRVTPTQVNAARAAGLGMVCNMEGSADPLAAARSIGMSYRSYGQNLAHWGLVDMGNCGVPAGAGIAMYFSVDVNTPPDQYPNVRELFDGINDVTPSAGYLTKVYSQGGLLDYLCAAGRVTGKQWLAAPTSWAGYNANDANLCMVQLVGSPVSGTDQNKVIDPKAIGAYWPPGSPYASVEDEVLDPSDPIVQQILAALAPYDATHSTTPQQTVGGCWKQLDDLRNDTNHVNTIPGVKSYVNTTVNAAAAALQQALTDVVNTGSTNVNTAMTAALATLQSQLTDAINAAVASGGDPAKAASAVVSLFAQKLGV
jgi:hypothetical protein